jgi:3-oxoacyl-[acyl-carrier protein] reductase
MRFQGKVALVTGAGKNIGAAIAKAFGAEGATVAAMDIDLSSAEKTAQEIRTAGGKGRAWKVDVSEAAAVAAVVPQVKEAFGRIDILVNNAGQVARKPEFNAKIHELTEEVWDQFFRVNAKGSFLMGRAVSQVMIRDKVPGRIINITSAAAESARVGGGGYCCSKAALAMLTRVMALELGPLGITVNSVSPGYIEVPQPGTVTPGRKEYREAFLRNVAMNRPGDPEDIARAVLFLAEEGASYITGENIRVDGGALAGRLNLPKSA